MTSCHVQLLHGHGPHLRVRVELALGHIDHVQNTAVSIAIARVERERPCLVCDAKEPAEGLAYLRFVVRILQAMAKLEQHFVSRVEPENSIAPAAPAMPAMSTLPAVRAMPTLAAVTALPAVPLTARRMLASIGILVVGVPKLRRMRQMGRMGRAWTKSRAFPPFPPCIPAAAPAATGTSS
jgi:hypothetical protein